MVWRGGVLARSSRAIPEETPIALTYNRTTHAVMLATPADLEDFAIGFSFSEGIIGHLSDIIALETVPLPHGIEARIDLIADRLDRLTLRQRRLAGPSGCGLCGIESLADAVRPVPSVRSGITVAPDAINLAIAEMPGLQVLNHETRAVHAAALFVPDQGIVALREDVGRHNALDKLCGALKRGATAPDTGFILLSSRISVEMVQKAAIIGVPIIVAVSAPTALAVRTAEASGVTLIGVARADGFEIFTHPQRIVPHSVQDVA